MSTRRASSTIGTHSLRCELDLFYLLNLFTDLSKVEVKVGRCLWIELTYEVVNQIKEREKKFKEI